jgi:hypothetical protein
MEQTTADSIKKVNESAKKLFGSDISISVARCPAWGDQDTCILVSGKRHIEAASDFARLRGAMLSTAKSDGFMGMPSYTYSKVTIPAEVSA